MPQLAGLVLDGKYRLTQPLGEGGMGFVYAGEHAVLGRPLAVKFLRPELAQDPTALARLRQEAIASSGIGSPHIVEVLDLGTAPGGMPFIVMEYLRGRTLAALLEAQPVLPVSRIVRVLSQTLVGLAAAHARGIVHRDLKPENVFLVESAGEDFVKLLDFGVSKVRGGLTTSNLTQTGAVLGTPRYMAPEQAAGRRDVDHRVDLWAGGVILYRALTGRFPFDAENYNALLAAILMQAPVPPRQFRPDLPPPLEAVILTALAREPDRRFGSAEQFRQALQPWLAEPSGMLYAASAAAAGAAPSATPYTPMPWPTGTPSPSTGAGVLPPGTPYPPTRAGAPTPGTPYPPGWTPAAAGTAPDGTTADRTVVPVGAQATAALPRRSRTGLRLALGLVLAAGVGSTVAWLVVARPWEDEPAATAVPAAPAAASSDRASPFAPHAAASRAGADAGPGVAVVAEPDERGTPPAEDEVVVVEPVEDPEAEGEDEFDQMYAQMMSQVQTMMQGQLGGEPIDPDNLTPEQQRERQAYIEIQAEISCAMSDMENVAPAGDSMTAAMQQSMDIMRVMEDAARRHGYGYLQYAQLATRWAFDPTAGMEVSKLVAACTEERERRPQQSPPQPAPERQPTPPTGGTRE
ncbi:MAG: serine/threonine protein kinase [Deltaproteobacteria bacterium]|nr:serine/threonine protein kinase [Deltaproteobacteria bacterium]